MASTQLSPQFQRAANAINPVESKNEERLLVLQKNSSMLDIRGRKLRVIHIKSKSELLPTLFFFHGAGGQAEQWLEQISYYYKRVAIVALDFVGHGQSEITDRLEDYTSASMVADMCEIFDRYHGRTNLIFAHSYGCSLVAKMLPRLPPSSVAGVAMCAPTLLAPGDVIHKPFHYLPVPLFNVLRYLDRWGGINSNSVKRMLHDSASDKLKRQQLAWNASTSTKVVKMMLESLDLAKLEDYKAIEVPFCLVSGENDKVTPSRLARMIMDAIEASNGSEGETFHDQASATHHNDTTDEPRTDQTTDKSLNEAARADTNTGTDALVDAATEAKDSVIGNTVYDTVTTEVSKSETEPSDTVKPAGSSQEVSSGTIDREASESADEKLSAVEEVLRTNSMGVTDVSADLFGSDREYPDDSEVEGKASDGDEDVSACESEREGDNDNVDEEGVGVRNNIEIKNENENDNGQRMGDNNNSKTVETDTDQKAKPTTPSLGNSRDGAKDSSTQPADTPLGNSKNTTIDHSTQSTDTPSGNNRDIAMDDSPHSTDTPVDSKLQVPEQTPSTSPSSAADAVSDSGALTVKPQHAEEVEEGRKIAHRLSHSRKKAARDAITHLAKQDAEATAALRSGGVSSGNENEKDASKVISRKTTNNSTRSLSAAASAEGRSKRVPQPHTEEKMVELHIISECGHQVMLEKKSIFNAVVNNFFIQTAGVTVLDRLHRLNRGDSVHDKWALKNYEKWSKTLNYGEPILFKNGTRGFVPMKVLRQDDANHSPSNFMAKNEGVGVVLDLTSQAPPYNTKDKSLPLYIKLAAESKKVPSKEYVQSFIQTVDNYWKNNPDSLVAVHCHYGFNRTGFLLASYLIERADYSVEEAIAAFKQSRPKGIRHQHFLDELFLRYTRRSSSVANKH